MAVWFDSSTTPKTADLLANVLYLARNGDRVQFLTSAGAGPTVMQRMRVALSRSRNRIRDKGKKLDEYSLMHEIYPFTQDGKRFDCVVMWKEKNIHHRKRELLDDLVERIEP